MAKNFKGEEIPAEYKNDELLWRCAEFSPEENSDYWEEKAFARQVAQATRKPLPLTEAMVDEFCDKCLKA